ncbi:hypothetical protein AB0M20_14305 [Actinoplanes sp. NPDC051633]
MERERADVVQQHGFSDAEPVQAIRADAVLWEIAELQPPFCRP